MRTRKLYSFIVMTALLSLVFTGSALAVTPTVVPATIDITANPTIIGFGEQVPLTITVNANEDLGKNYEYWVIVTTPYGNKYTHNGTAWINGMATFGQGPLADFTTILTTDPMALSGNYTIEASLDPYVNGTKDVGAIYDTITVTVNPEVQVAPEILVTVNGQTKPTLNIGDTAAIRIQMDTGTYGGLMTEWWVIVAAPNGDKYYYTSLNQWAYDPVGHPALPEAYNWAPLVNADKTIVSPIMDLPGNWSVYFGVDDKQDNQAAMVVYGRATIHVPGNLPQLGLNLFLPHGVTNPNMWPGDGGNLLSIGLDTQMSAGTYTNMHGELWLIAKAPDGQMHYWDNTAHVWFTHQTPAVSDTIGNIALAVDGMNPLAMTPNLDQYGTWTFYLLLDAAQNGQIDLDYYLFDQAYMVIGNNPKVDLYTDGTYSISHGGPYLLTAYVYPGVYGSRYVDFWCVAVSPYGVYYSLKDRLINAWVSGVDYYLQDLLDSPLFGQIDHSGGPHPADPSGAHDRWNYIMLDVSDKIKEMTGTWTLYFGFDNLNGYLDSNTVYGTTRVRVNP